MMEQYFIENTKARIAGEYDVIVVGGGVAGVGAALAAKRNGCSVLLVEKGIMLGGLATAGIIAYYLPMCDGNGRKIIGGIAEELLFLSIKYGYDNLPDEWKGSPERVNTTKRYRTTFSPPEFVIALDEIIEKEGVHLLFDTVFCSSVVEDEVCKGIIVENKSGRLYYGARAVVDATGDAEVMFKSGAPCKDGDNWLTYWAYTTSLQNMKEAVEKDNVLAGIRMLTIGGNRDGENAPPGAKKYSGTNTEDITRFILDGRRMLREKFCTGEKAGKSIISIPSMPELRTIRRIEGIYEFTGSEDHVHFEDSIGCIGDFRWAGPVYEIPYRSLVTNKIKNVIAAGRCISASGVGWEVTRVIPPACLTGQAAGTAASIAVKDNLSFDAVPVDKLQKLLESAGVMIHF